MVQTLFSDPRTCGALHFPSLSSGSLQTLTPGARATGTLTYTVVYSFTNRFHIKENRDVTFTILIVIQM